MEAICKADFEKRVKANKEADKLRKKTEKDKKSTASIIVPEGGYHDLYGVWFFGRLKAIIQKIGMERFDADLEKTMHVFVDVDPKKISEGIHDIEIYGHSCRLYKWMAQGYHRGIVVLVDDEAGNSDAEAYRKSGTWSWILLN
jgi:hypothetical protein